MCITCQENNIFLSDVPVQPETPEQPEGDDLEVVAEQMAIEYIELRKELDVYLDKCSSMDEMEQYIDEIRTIDVVVDAYTIGNGIVIVTKAGIKLFLNYTIVDSTASIENKSESLMDLFTTRSPASDDVHEFLDLSKDDKICIINQTTNDVGFNWLNARYTDLALKIAKAGYNVEYINAGKATLEWFYKHLTEYDFILFCTHGSYDDKDGLHTFATGEIFDYVEDIEDVENVEDLESHILYTTKAIYSRLKYGWQGQISTHKERRHVNGREEKIDVTYWALSENSFRKMNGRFENAVIFFASCKTLERNHNIANILKGKGASVILGYDDTNTVGPLAGCDFMLNMLKGMSVGQAYDALGSYTIEKKEDFKPDNSDKLFTYTSRLHYVGNENVCIVHPEVATGYVNVDGFNAVLHGCVKGTNNIMECKAAFCYSKNKNDLEIGKSGVDSTAWNVIEGDLEKEVKFEAELKSLKENTEYYYRAVVKSEENYFYGEVKSFETEIEDKEEPDFVDLGLPSGVKWARCNIDAYSPNESGTFYTWYDIANTVFFKEMPTEEDFEELFEYCTFSVEVTGVRCIGLNGNSIFLPFAGYKNNSGWNYRDERCYLWTQTEYEYNIEDAICAYMSIFEGKTPPFSKYTRMPIRLVRRSPFP